MLTLCPKWFVWLGLGVACLTGMPTVRGQDMAPPEVTIEVQKAVERGLDFLARSQSPEGYWRTDVGYKLNFSYKITNSGGRHVGVTALACMAFLANGSLPGRGKYGRNVEQGLRYILSRVKDSGFITDEGSRMYSHAFATLFLAEVYGMTHRMDVRSGLKRATQGIVQWQNNKGGWRYSPLASDADLSVTVCQLQALRAARNVGIQVNPATIDKAIRYVVNCARRNGPFKYQDADRSRDSFALTAAGLTSLFSAGVYEDESRMLREAIAESRKDIDRIIANGVIYLQQQRNDVQRNSYFYYYGHYYAAQAMYIVGGPQWERWYEYISGELLAIQLDDGTWHYQVGPAFSTAMACIILQVPYRYLPIFQR